jgi:hypothetical protein
LALLTETLENTGLKVEKAVAGHFGYTFSFPPIYGKNKWQLAAPSLSPNINPITPKI